MMKDDLDAEIEALRWKMAELETRKQELGKKAKKKAKLAEFFACDDVANKVANLLKKAYSELKPSHGEEQILVFDHDGIVEDAPHQPEWCSLLQKVFKTKEFVKIYRNDSNLKRMLGEMYWWHNYTVDVKTQVYSSGTCSARCETGFYYVQLKRSLGKEKWRTNVQYTFASAEIALKRRTKKEGGQTVKGKVYSGLVRKEWLSDYGLKTCRSLGTQIWFDGRSFETSSDESSESTSEDDKAKPNESETQ